MASWGDAARRDAEQTTIRCAECERLKALLQRARAGWDAEALATDLLAANDRLTEDVRNLRQQNLELCAQLAVLRGASIRG